ncbi:hypothetical protein CEXT_136931 [Caerostris extrusa]|uniref:Uncharacterized protein n=1 Tax=Caerostris extrusa TaxID=172846 RepID=A0AAV4U7M8_CAEEX|nr:hypothetical protein CEXT_136931 [Caerostris extrusa]
MPQGAFRKPKSEKDNSIQSNNKKISRTETLTLTFYLLNYLSLHRTGFKVFPHHHKSPRHLLRTDESSPRPFLKSITGRLPPTSRLR